MMIRSGWLFIAVLAASAVSGCTHFRYADRQFTDRAKAEAAQREDFDGIKSAPAFKSRAMPLARAMRVVIPSKTLLLDRGVIPTGSADGRDYVATTLHADYTFTGELIRQRNIFEQTTIEDSPDAGHVTPNPDEAVIYFYLPDNKTASWYYVSNATKRTPLHFDRGNPDKIGKIKYFIDSVEALAAGEPK